jgi:hypothetical protein
MSDEGASRRSRRSKGKVNYAKEQDFSDEDIFGDEVDDEIEVRAPVNKRVGRPPKSKKGKQQQEDSTQYMDDDDGGIYRPPKPQYTEKGYDPTLPPIRERFSFLPEYELDGSPRIDLIVGRRPVDEKETADDDDDDMESSDDKENSQGDDDDSEEMPRNRRNPKIKRGKVPSPSRSDKEADSDVIEYEYLVKYRNRSYLHLEWKTGADLESMNKSAKTIYRRYLKKVAQGMDEELEDPNFDPSFAEPQKILAEEEQELELELSDKDLLEWEKEKEKELAEESSSEDEKDDESKPKEQTATQDVTMKTEESSAAATSENKTGTFDDIRTFVLQS